MIETRWTPGVPNEVTFVMVDAADVELAGLTLTILIRYGGGNFVAAAGSWSELSGVTGFYNYVSTAAEAAIGPISMVVTAPGAKQQNLEYVCAIRNSGFNYFPYYVYKEGTIIPIEGVRVEAYPTSTKVGTPHFTGVTNASGAALDNEGNFPLLDPGDWYFWRKKGGWEFDNPDMETVT